MNALVLHLLCESLVVQDQIALDRVSGLMLLDFIFAAYLVTFFGRRFQIRRTWSDIGRGAHFRGWQRLARCFDLLDLVRVYCVGREGMPYWERIGPLRGYGACVTEVRRLFRAWRCFR